MAQQSETESFDTIVIGGGQAGLTTGYYLAQQKRDFVILDANQRTGDSWRNRWDSLRLFTPARIDGLPGMRFPAPGSTFITKDEMADYVEAYASHFDFPIRHGVKVDGLSRDGDRFLISSGDKRFVASNVVVAMSNCQVPWVPPFAAELDRDIVQIHSKEYKNPSQLARWTGAGCRSWKLRSRHRDRGRAEPLDFDVGQGIRSHPVPDRDLRRPQSASAARAVHWTSCHLRSRRRLEESFDRRCCTWLRPSSESNPRI